MLRNCYGLIVSLQPLSTSRPQTPKTQREKHPDTSHPHSTYLTSPSAITSLHLYTSQTQCAGQARLTKGVRGVNFVTTLSVSWRSLREKAYESVTTVKRTLNTRDVWAVASSFPHGLTMAPVVPDRERPLREHAYESVGY